MSDIGLNTHQRNLVMPTFLNMSLLVTNLVLEKMEPMDLLRARKVCRSLRTAVDNIGLLFGYIYLILRNDKVELSLRGSEIIYYAAENGSTNVAHNGHEKLIDGEHFVDRALKDLKILSKHARKIIIRNSKNSDIVTNFNKFLKSDICIPVKEIRLLYFSFDEVLTVLLWFDAKVLKNIALECIESFDQFERITYLEQWENAEEFGISFSFPTIASTMIVHFCHFKCFSIHQWDKFPEQTAIQIRDDLLKRSTFQGCEISFEKTKANPIEIAKVFKPDYAGGNEFNIEYSNGNNKFDILLETWTASSNYFELNVKRL